MRRMKIVIAPDSFKESLPATAVAQAVRRGLAMIFPDAAYDLAPMADGGEGTVDAMVHATGGRFVKCPVGGPMGRPVEARFGILGDQQTAVIEMAAASGLPLVPRDQRNPMIATTRGTGELIAAALREKATRIIIGIGGSATVDGGAGAVEALGARLLDERGEPIGSGGRGLRKLSTIEMDGFDPRIRQTEILVACDVTNPLTGPHGAARVYGPQKGATPEMVAALDENLKHYARVVKERLGIDIDTPEGAGAAGGLGAALMGFCGARLESGSQLVAEAIGLSERLCGADLCVTGEGRIDGQSSRGKVCQQVARMAQRHGVPAVALVGGVGPQAETMIPPLSAFFSIVNQPMELSEAMARADELLEASAEQVGRLWQTAITRRSPDA